MTVDDDWRQVLSPSGEWFAVVDGGRYDDLPSLLRAKHMACRSLFLDTADEDIQSAGPWLVRLDEQDSLDKLAHATGGLAECVFWHCGAGEVVVYKHLRTLAMVEQPSGERVMFRHYDPRVLIVFARHLEAHQESRFFGPCAEIVVYAQRFTRSGMHS